MKIDVQGMLQRSTRAEQNITQQKWFKWCLAEIFHIFFGGIIQRFRVVLLLCGDYILAENIIRIGTISCSVVHFSICSCSCSCFFAFAFAYPSLSGFSLASQLKWMQNVAIYPHKIDLVASNSTACFAQFSA